MEFNRIIEIENRNISRSIVRLNNALIDRSKSNKKLFYRRNPVKITNENNGQWSIAFAYGSPGIKGLTKKTIGIDYDTADVLGIKEGEFNLKIKLTKANCLDVWLWYLNHPDHNISFNTKVALIALIISVISLITTFF